MTQEWLSACEVAAMLGLCTTTVRRYIRSGELPGKRIGKRSVRVSREDVLAYLRRCRDARK